MEGGEGGSGKNGQKSGRTWMVSGGGGGGGSSGNRMSKTINVFILFFRRLEKKITYKFTKFIFRIKFS